MIDPRLSWELLYTSLTALFTGVLWIPNILNRLRELGIRPALSNPQPDVRAEVNWAYRLADAHRNAIENLVVFTPLAIAGLVLGLGTAHTGIFAARIAPLRTVAFAIGFGCQVYLAARVLGWL